MKRKRERIGHVLSRHLERYGEPSQEQVLSGIETVWLKIENNVLSAPSLELTIRPSSSRVRVGLAVSTAVAAAVAMAVLFWPAGNAGIIEGTNRKVYYGEAVRSSAAGDMLLLADGSRVELRARSEVRLERAGDGSRIQLNDGAVIISAARNRSGQQVYIQTKDVNVKATGTVFVVKAEKEGSRVAAIDGEVRVNRQASEEQLLPGEQAISNPLMESLALREEISWSRNLEAHLALLQQAAPIIQSESARPRAFEVASIRPHSGLSDGVESLGLLCHGIDGVRRGFPEDVGLSGRMVAPLGRCRGTGVLLPSLIAFAYGVPNRNILGLPEWASPAVIAPGLGLTSSAFQFDAVAADPSTATLDELREMLQTLLADRFRLRLHRETRNRGGYALVVAKNGPKPALKKTSVEPELPVLDTNSAGQPAIRGKSGMDLLAQFLSGSLGVGGTNFTIVNKTGLEGIYEYEFTRVGRGTRGENGARPSLEEMERLRTEALSDSIEDQLGVRLQPEKEIPVQVLMIEHVEKPSPN